MTLEEIKTMMKGLGFRGYNPPSEISNATLAFERRMTDALPNPKNDDKKPILYVEVYDRTHYRCQPKGPDSIVADFNLHETVGDLSVSTKVYTVNADQIPETLPRVEKALAASWKAFALAMKE